MKGKIDKDGFLWIERGGVLKLQLCPYQSDGTEVASRSQNDGSPDVIYNLQTHCGDWCPLFGEPSFGYKLKLTPNDDGISFTEEKIYNKSCTLNLCKRLLCFDDFTDERNNAEV